MANNKTPYYTNSYLLSSLVQSQQHIPHKYDVRDYFGGCMRIQEEQTASFLYDFVNGTAIVLPRHYELVRNLLFILRRSGYKPIKKLLPMAVKKFDNMLIAQRARIAAADAVRPTNLNTPGVNKFSVLANKKKMLMMSCTDICALGDAINNEHEFNTTKIKSKFASFVSYRIELVLMGKMPIDTDFPVLLKKYGTPHQIKRYTNIISNKTTLHHVPQKQPVQKTPVKVTQIKPKENKSKGGFFKKLSNKISNTTKSVLNAVKKPVLVIGIFGAAIFGGKKAADFIESENHQPQVAQEYFQQTTSNTVYNTDTTKKLDIQQRVNETQSSSVNVQKPQNVSTPTNTAANDVLQKSIKRLQQLKETNPTDKDMDVIATANKLYEQFGRDAYNVILTGITAPYALNNFTKFNIRPTTHEIIKYLTNNNLTAIQRAELDAFVAGHIAQMKFTMQKQSQNQR
ncbi:MAG: hypothetical protein NC311_02675 [Muribaculaceae bacterium]|nr:hypothetical protein [Muribaculaceae bacterium]